MTLRYTGRRTRRRAAAVLLAALLVLVSGACAPGAENGQKTLNVLNWGDYIDPDVVPLFEEENPDIRLAMSTTDSNEAMYVTTATEGSQIDVIIPSEYMIQRMMQEDMLAELDHGLIPNYRYVEEFTRRTCTYDPDGLYSMPYAWGTFGILYNTDMVDEEIRSWDAVFDPEYQGSILMYDSIRDSLGVALLELGYDINTTDQTEIDQATQLLVDQKPLVLAYGTDDLKLSMINNSAAIAVMYAGDASLAMTDNESLAYVIPEEGANIFVDSFAILKTTDVYEEACRFINFMLRPDIAAKNALYTGYSTPEEAALPYIAEADPEMLENNAFLPSDEEIAACMYYRPLSRDDMKKYEYAWLTVKVA